jgi:hypothetical protein
MSWQQEHVAEEAVHLMTGSRKYESKTKTESKRE